MTRTLPLIRRLRLIRNLRLIGKVGLVFLLPLAYTVPLPRITLQNRQGGLRERMEQKFLLRRGLVRGKGLLVSGLRVLVRLLHGQLVRVVLVGQLVRQRIRSGVSRERELVGRGLMQRRLEMGRVWRERL